jgi:hypothetical protein
VLAFCALGGSLAAAVAGTARRTAAALALALGVLGALDWLCSASLNYLAVGILVGTAFAAVGRVVAWRLGTPVGPALAGAFWGVVLGAPIGAVVCLVSALVLFGEPSSELSGSFQHALLFLAFLGGGLGAARNCSLYRRKT